MKRQRSDDGAKERKPEAPPKRVKGKIGEVVIKDLDGKGEVVIPVDITKRPKPAVAGEGAAGGSGKFEPCWNCGSREHKRSDCDKKQEDSWVRRRSSQEICLRCREKGHLLRDCPQATGSAGNRGGGGGGGRGNFLCFNCGSTDHSVRDCTKNRSSSSLPYATCFVCNKSGHIARDCPSGEQQYGQQKPYSNSSRQQYSSSNNSSSRSNGGPSKRGRSYGGGYGGGGGY